LEDRRSITNSAFSIDQVEILWFSEIQSSALSLIVVKYRSAVNAKANVFHILKNGSECFGKFLLYYIKDFGCDISDEPPSLKIGGK